MSANPDPTHPEARPPLPFFVRAFASALFTGYIPFASGTFGSLVGLAFYLIPGFEGPYVIMPACFLVLLAGARLAEPMEAAYGHDPAQVTIDEVLGMWVSLFLLPKNWLVAAAAFFVFRFFDIVKPFPARRFDRQHGGFAIMMDDVVAGVYTNLLLHLALMLPFVQRFL